MCGVCVCLRLCFQDEPHGARCEHEKATGRGLKDKTEVPAGDGEKLPWTGGGAGEEGTCTHEKMALNDLNYCYCTV